MYESSFSPAVWVLVEESICTLFKEGTKTLKLVITLCIASVCKLGKQDLISTIRSFRFALLYAKGKNHFLHNFYHFVSMRRKIVKRTGGVFLLFSYFKTSKCFNEPQMS